MVRTLRRDRNLNWFRFCRLSRPLAAPYGANEEHTNASWLNMLINGAQPRLLYYTKHIGLGLEQPLQRSLNQKHSKPSFLNKETRKKKRITTNKELHIHNNRLDGNGVCGPWLAILYSNSWPMGSKSWIKRLVSSIYSSKVACTD